MSFEMHRRQLLEGLALASLANGAPAFAGPEERWEILNTEKYQGKQDDIFFVSRNTGWYGNGRGKLFSTNDGGDTWQLLWEQPGTYIRAIGFVDAKTGFLGNIGVDDFPNVTDPCPLYQTVDGGRTWLPITAVSGPLPRGICAIDILKTHYINAGTLDHRITIRAGGRVGGPAHLLESRNLGRSWTSRNLSPLTEAILDIHFISEAIGFIAGASAAEVERSNAVILKTIDGGETWRRVYQSRREFEITWKLSFPSMRTGYVTVQNYNPEASVSQRYVAKTVDGGETWQELPVASDHNLQEFGIAFVNERRGWVGGRPHGFETVDGGKTWSSADLGVAANKIRVVRDLGRTRLFSIGSDVRRLDL